MRFIVFVLVALVSFSVFGSGGKNRTLNPILDEDGCVITVPTGIDVDEEFCTKIPAPDQSGIESQFCSIIVQVSCPED